MEQLIKLGFISPGDKIFITKKPNNSIATLINYKYVDFNGKKLTLNEWGCKVTGWKSIRIYSNMSKVGEKETLQDKRERYLRSTKNV